MHPFLTTTLAHDVLRDRRERFERDATARRRLRLARRGAPRGAAHGSPPGRLVELPARAPLASAAAAGEARVA